MLGLWRAFLSLFKPDREFVGDPMIGMRLVLKPGNLVKSPILPGRAHSPGLPLAMRRMLDLERWKRARHVVPVFLTAVYARLIRTVEVSSGLSAVCDSPSLTVRQCARPRGLIATQPWARRR